jgi:hypothetical protein
MRPIRGEYLILIGFVLVLLGAILPFLMVMKILTSTFFLNFFSYTASVAGLFMGVAGVSYLVRYRRNKDRGISPPMEPPHDQNQDW